MSYAAEHGFTQSDWADWEREETEAKERQAFESEERERLAFERRMVQLDDDQEGPF